MVVIESPDGDAAGARHATAEFLARHCPWADPDAVVLVVSELVANAIRHTGGWWRLCVRAVQGRLVVEIADASPEPPTPRVPDLTGGGGLGWHMVEKLATQLEVVRQGDGQGKTVRATWLRPALPLAV
ncbi:ATP-binding protein [Streptomyces albireticuli]|uniref:ATP-binding protein n=1 Tax=Streptomyces albireticuli TaxID=1940 RepID=UPI001E568825|nr:ATP-binding protein [Streptomyces albireticuli]MCD9142438.1 ATP-binding protein [Streptomyces albireticuli]MCD9163838.1 ATP-binding protein [Streptomyces albireticuli]MCD9192566.1 ATP-binding protein [Streptomyces albireticuli]